MSKGKSSSKSIAVRIDPKLKFIIDIISSVDQVSMSDIMKRGFLGRGEDINTYINYSLEMRVEDFKEIEEDITNKREPISARIDGELYNIIKEEAKQEGVTKTDVIESALWDYVEKEGFEKSPVTDDYIKISVELPGRFKKFTGKT
ncbi:MAG TPA: hypothetical protein VK982_07710 [Bacteroidales bacterium]|nr:hypothetical protein [Bacteroidales bacterium]